MTLHKTDAGKADYRNERKKFGSHNCEPRSDRIVVNAFPLRTREKDEGRIKNYEVGRLKETEVRTKNAEWNERGERHAR